MRADVEGDAVGLEPEAVGMLQHVGRHLRHAAELARQGPFGAGAVAQDAAEHLGALRHAGDLLDLGLAIDREEPHAELEGPGDVALLLDRVAEGDAVRRGAGRQHHLDLLDRGAVEARAEGCQQAQHLRRRVRLDGVVDPGVRQGVGEGVVVVPDDVEVDDEAGPVIAARTKELTDACGHGTNLPKVVRSAAMRSGTQVELRLSVPRHGALETPMPGEDTR